MTEQQQQFSLVAIYENNHQRFADSGPGNNVTDALIALMHQLHKDYKVTAGELMMVGVFAGAHDAKDNDVQYSDERPKRTSKSGAELRPYTVVSDEKMYHVMAANAANAELDLEDSECLQIGAVFEGHLTDISAQVDWDRFYAGVPQSEEVENA
jgi:hypothetical protein